MYYGIGLHIYHMGTALAKQVKWVCLGRHVLSYWVIWVCMYHMGTAMPKWVVQEIGTALLGDMGLHVSHGNCHANMGKMGLHVYYDSV